MEIEAASELVFDPPPDAEWLCATGRGGYALGTESGIATRRYHGNLVVALPPPLGRVMVWSRTEELLRVGGEEAGLTAGWYRPGVLAPPACAVLVGFEQRSGVPTWVFEVDRRRVTRRLFVDAASATLEWSLEDGPPAELFVRPLLTWRSHHHLSRADGVAPERELLSDGLRWRRGQEAMWVRITWDGEIADETEHVYRDAFLPTERARGYDDSEDLHAPVQIRATLGAEPVRMTVALDHVAASQVGSARPEDDPGADPAAAFVVVHPDGRPGVIAGYPWFTEWSRDTMIALPGLLLPDRAALMREILGAWVARIDHGLLPCQLHDLGSGALHTNAADAPLRMVQAIASLHAASEGLVDASLRAAVNEILDAYHAGTRHGIRVDPADGLLAAGESGCALTWMDAVLPEGPVTPRRGKPIDLNALYLLGLRFAATLEVAAGDSARAEVLGSRANHCAESIAERFPDPLTGWLRDVVDSEDPGGGELRPNVLVALATEGLPWPDGCAHRTLEAVEENLLTPYGLRTLEPSHEDYVGRYGGTQARRDRAYHQGTVWPWLVGSYVDAVLAVRGNKPSIRNAIRLRLQTLVSELSRGSLPEVYDGDPPHRTGGCPAQAWSVSEVTRAWRRVSEG